MIIAEGLSKIYRVHRKEPGFMGSVKSLFVRDFFEKAALRDVSLRVERGEIVGLLGANGAGKTTLVKILSGIIQPTSGRAEVLGYNPSERPIPLRHQMALIMGQKAQLWWDLPAADAFLLLREIYKIPAGDFRERVKTLSQALEVEGQLNVQIRRLSLGERMKMEIMAALLHRPKVIFLDEPTIGLDISAQKSIRKFLKDYQRAEAPAMVLTSHYMEDIEDLCRRIVIVRQGGVVFDGAITELSGAATRTKKLTFSLHENGETDSGASVTDFVKRWSVETPSAPPAGATVSIDVERERLPDCIGDLLHKFRVADLLVQEEDISHLIEQIQRGVR